MAKDKSNNKPNTDKSEEKEEELETLEPQMVSTSEDTEEVEEKIIPMNVQAARAKKRAFAKKVVIISSNDKRDNDTATTVYATCENQYFALAKIIPLNIEVQVEQCLLDALSDVEIMLQTDVVKDGVALGVATPTFIKKYNIIVVKENAE
nr:MAG TPA: hypothetical protein [Caudoviricetes sp.]